METKDTGSSDWPEDEPQTEQKVTLEDYQQLIIQMRRANVQFQQLCNIPSGELTMLLTLRRLLLVKTFVIPSDIGDARSCQDQPYPECFITWNGKGIWK